MTIHDARHGRFSCGLGIGLALLIGLVAGCVTEKEEDGLASIISEKKHDNAAAYNVGKSAKEAFPEDSASPEGNARRKAWLAACKAVRKALAKAYADRGDPTFVVRPTILQVEEGRYHIFGYGVGVGTGRIRKGDTLIV